MPEKIDGLDCSLSPLGQEQTPAGSLDAAEILADYEQSCTASSPHVLSWLAYRQALASV
jgi:hypothetical protein